MKHSSVDTITVNGRVVGWDDEIVEEISIAAMDQERYEALGYQVATVSGHSIAFKNLEFEDGTIQIQPKSDMLGRIASTGGHSNWGYSGYFRGYVYLDGKRRRLVDFWKLFPNNEHHYQAQQDKPQTEAFICKAIEKRTGTKVIKVRGGYAFDPVKI